MAWALLVLAVIGVVALWLRGVGAIDPRLAGTPYVELELPPPGADPKSGEAAVVPASSDAPVTDEKPAAEAAEAADAAGPPRPEGETGAPDATGAPDGGAPESGIHEDSAEGPDGPDPTAMKPPAAPEAPAPEESAPEEPSPMEPAPEGPSTEKPETEGSETGGPETVTSQSPARDAATGPEPKAPTADSPAADDAAGSPQVAAAGLPGAAPLPAWRRFARPFPADDPRPRIAVIVAELGLSEASTRAAIERLPAAVTLSFSPYGNRLQARIDAARAAGHEVMLDLPMEPVSYPLDDPGPKALFTALSEVENRLRLEWVLDRAAGYVGVVPWMGSRFTTSAEDMRPVLAQIDERGLMFVDARPSPDSVVAGLADDMGVPRAVNTRFLDHVPSREAIEGRLRQIEREARATGFAVGIASPYPITIETLERWIPTLDDKDLVLAPVSALADRQEAAR